MASFTDIFHVVLTVNGYISSVICYQLHYSWNDEGTGFTFQAGDSPVPLGIVCKHVPEVLKPNFYERLR